MRAATKKLILFGHSRGRNAPLPDISCSVRVGNTPPTVYREDYLPPLKALSNNADPAPFIASMTRVHAWSAAFDFGQPRDQLRAQLAACNAFQEDLHTYRLVFP